MNFTDRFIKLPIKIYNKKDAEVMGKAEYEDSWMAINPMEVCTYKPTVDLENEVYEATYLTLKNGDGFYVYQTIKEFEELLNNYNK